MPKDTQILWYIPSYLTSPVVATEVKAQQFNSLILPNQEGLQTKVTQLDQQAFRKFELAVKWDSLKKLYTNISREK